MFSPVILLTAFAALAVAAPMADQSPAEPRGLLSGQLTWYTEGMGVSPTACGTVHQVTEVHIYPLPFFPLVVFIVPLTLQHFLYMSLQLIILSSSSS